MSPDPRRAFVVHGRNELARQQMFDFLRAIGLDPIEWTEAVGMTGKAAPYIGEVLDAAFEAAQAIVVLFTPDEVAYLIPKYAGEDEPGTQPAAQSRPNVLFEAGMATGRDAVRAVLVQLGETRPFSDIAGKHTVRLDDTAATRKDLAQRLQRAGCSVNLSGDDWLRPGAFSVPPPPGAGLPLGRRLPPAPQRRGVKIDLRYHHRDKGGRLEIVNQGTEDVHDLNIEIPADIQSFHVIDRELPIERLPSGKSVSLLAVLTSGPGRGHFDVRVTGRTADGEAVDEIVFLDTRG